MTTAIDLTKPALSDAYATFQAEIVAGLQAGGSLYDTTYWSTVNQPTGTKRFNASNSLVESWNGSSWVSALAYLQTGNSGSQSVAGTVNFSGTLNYGGSVVATQAWVTSQSYETTSALSATLASYATTASLASYATTASLASATVAHAGDAAALTGASPALGTQWQIDANGQLSNNANTLYFASYYASAATTSGTTVLFNTLVGSQGSNWSISGGVLTIYNPGLYRVTAMVTFTDPAAGNYNLTIGFFGTAGGIYGPASGTARAYPVPIPGASGGVDACATVVALVRTTAINQTISLVTSLTMSASLTCAAGSALLVERIG